MRIVFIHQNFPGQFGHLAAALQQRGHDVIALTVDTNQRPSPIPVARYKVKQKEFDKRVFQTAATFAERAHRGEAAARAAFSLRKRMSLVPDVIIGHPGWGETLFVKEVWPESRLLVYAEFFYRTRGLDVNFDSEFANDLLSSRMHVIAQQAHMLLAISNADKALAPTRWQAETFPEDLRNRITVIHDGIDTDRVRPRDTASVQLPGSR